MEVLRELKVKNLTKNIKGTTILEDISFSMEDGHIYGLHGKNGSGKTMLMRTLCGLIVPSEGEVVIDALSWQRH